MFPGAPVVCNCFWQMQIFCEISTLRVSNYHKCSDYAVLLPTWQELCALQLQLTNVRPLKPGAFVHLSVQFKKISRPYAWKHWQRSNQSLYRSIKVAITDCLSSFGGQKRIIYCTANRHCLTDLRRKCNLQYIYIYILINSKSVRSSKYRFLRQAILNILNLMNSYDYILF